MAPSLYSMKTNEGADQVYGFPKWLKRHNEAVDWRPESMHCLNNYKDRENMKLAQKEWSANMINNKKNQPER